MNSGQVALGGAAGNSPLFTIAFLLLHGGITQLVECLLCKQDVAGSNPATSTNAAEGDF